MNKIFYIIKRVIFAILMLYTYNIVAVSYNLMIPINIITVTIVSFIDIPGLFILGLILRLFYWG